jgi:peptidoglycan/xylan/chitin deacetylase (PgdA/CDA1 family)
MSAKDSPLSRVAILMYHIVAKPLSAQEARYCCSPTRFEAHMRHLAQSGTQLLALDEVVDGLDGRVDLPADSIAVTFDDGFADTFVNALPVLTRYRIPATMFALSDRIGGRNDWMSVRGFPERPLMAAAQLREMVAAGITVGSHTRTHPRLPELDAKAKRDEISGSKARLEDMLGSPVRSFAYPYGLFDEDTRLAVEEAGYRSACSVRAGFNALDVDRFLLRRIEVFGTDSLWRFRQKLKFGANDVSHFYPIRYYAGRISARLGF